MSRPANPCQNTYPLKTLGSYNTSQRLVLLVQMKRKNTIHSHRGAAAVTKGYCTFPLCWGIRENYNSLAEGWGTGGVVKGAMQIGFGHRSKDLSFTASSGLEQFYHSPQTPILSAPFLLTLLHSCYRSTETVFRGASWQSVNIALTCRPWTEMWTLMVFGRARVLSGHTAGAERKQAGKRDRMGGVWDKCRERPGVLAAAGLLALQQHHLSLWGEPYNIE